MTQLTTEPTSRHEPEPTGSAIERIAALAAAAQPEQLTSDIRHLFKRNIPDSVGCAIAADQAALFNSGLVRYVDLLDSYMAPGGLCHPSDNFGTILAAAEQAGASGEEFILALAVAYEIQCRFSAAVPVMAKGFNHATQLAISAAASAGKLLGLSAVEIANAIASAGRRLQVQTAIVVHFKQGIHHDRARECSTRHGACRRPGGEGGWNAS